MTIPWYLLARIATATVLGGAIGWERDRHGRPAGLRTHMVVALASATFMVISTHFLEYDHWRHGENADVSRIASTIVTGIGFLGGGAIIRTGFTIQGLTTAAGLWLVGAIGMAAGGGMYAIALFTTLLGLVTLGVLRRFEDKDADSISQRLHVVLDAASSTTEVESRMRRLGIHVSTLSLRADHEAQVIEADYDLRMPHGLAPEAAMDALNDLPALRSVRIQREGQR